MWDWERRLGFSSPNSLGQPLRDDVGCVQTTCSSSVPLLFMHFCVGTKSYPVYYIIVYNSISSPVLQKA